MATRIVALGLCALVVGGCCGVGDPSQAEMRRWEHEVIGMTNDDAMEHMKKLGLEIAHTIGDRIGPPMTIRAVKTTSSCLIAGNYHEAYISAQVDPTTLRVTSARSGVDVIETKFDP
jgi:hypothetical protein